MSFKFRKTFTAIDRSARVKVRPVSDSASLYLPSQVGTVDVFSIHPASNHVRGRAGHSNLTGGVSRHMATRRHSRLVVVDPTLRTPSPALAAPLEASSQRSSSRFTIQGRPRRDRPGDCRTQGVETSLSLYGCSLKWSKSAVSALFRGAVEGPAAADGSA